MIKFRCPQCGQKIASDEDGVGLEISCPNCAIVQLVPLETAAEFQTIARPAVLELMTPPPPVAARINAGSLPSTFRTMLERLVQVLFRQRQQLLHTQQEGTAELLMLEQRLSLLQIQMSQRYSDYEQRIAEQEAQLAIMKEENRRLVEEKLALASTALAALPSLHAHRKTVAEYGVLAGS